MENKINLIEDYLSSKTEISFDEIELRSILDFLEIIILWDDGKFNQKTLDLAEKTLIDEFGHEGDIDWSDLVVYFKEVSPNT